MNNKHECLVYIKRWYMCEPVWAIRLAVDDDLERAMQMIVVELLRDLFDNPMPGDMVEGTSQFNHWMAVAFHRAQHGVKFDFKQEEVSSIKNLAWTYFAVGISNTQRRADPIRLYETTRRA